MTSSKRNRRSRRDALGEPAPEGAAPTGLRAKLLLVLLGIAGALIAGEVVIRLFDLGPDLNIVYKRNLRLSLNPILDYELVPGSRDGAFQVSAAGLRDKDYPVQKPPGTFRILIIGDSIAYGFGVRQNETFSAQLEDLLTTYWPREDLRFEVLNLGVTGYSIEQVVENLRVRGLRFSPDLVIYAYCLNDPMAYSFELESLKAQLSNAKATYREELLHRGESIAAKLRTYILMKYAWHALQSKGMGDADLEDKQWTSIAEGSYDRFFDAMYDDKEGADRLRSGVEALRQISQSTGVPAVTIIFPVFYELAAYRLRHLHERVERLHVDYGGRVYDLLGLYAKMYESHGNTFVHNALHPNAVGHRLGALYVLLRLDQDGLLPLSTPWAGQPTPRDRALAKVAEETMQPPESVGGVGAGEVLTGEE